MKSKIAVYIPAATVVRALKRELGEAQILFLLASCHIPDTPESGILLAAGNKLLKLERTKEAEKARIKKIGDFDAIPGE